MQYQVRTPDLDDWYAVRAFHQRFQESMYFDRLRLSIDALKGWFDAARQPGMPVGMFLLFGDPHESFLCGMALVEMIVERIDLRVAQRALIRGVYVEPEYRGEGVDALERVGEDWVKSRGGDMLLGQIKFQVEGDYSKKHLDSLIRHGYHPLYVVLGKHLEGVT